MRVGITGGTGFVGRHLAKRFPASDVVLVSRRTGTAIDDVDALTRAFEGCDAVAHFAGINREIGEQNFNRVHVQGTAAVIEAARRAGVRKIVLLSFLRARPGSGSPYHESKWVAEEMVRSAGLEYTVLKAGMIYGNGDHLVNHLSRTIHTIPLFASVGLREKTISPIPVEELVDVAAAALGSRLKNQTVAVTGGETLLLSEAARRVAKVLDRHLVIVPLPVAFHRALAQVTEWTMKVPLLAKAQARMLAEGVTDAALPAAELPDDLRPRLQFDDRQIREALPQSAGFGWRDLRASGSRSRAFEGRRSPDRPSGGLLEYGEEERMTSPEDPVWPPSNPRYRRSEASAIVGRGDAVWERAARDVLHWRVKTESGFSVDQAGPVTQGQHVTVTARVLKLRVLEPVEVVSVVDEPDRIGFAYRTLPGHPVSGEEAFIVHRHGDEVRLTVRSLTRPAPQGKWRLLYPLLRIVQVVVRRRYLRALR